MGAKEEVTHPNSEYDDRRFSDNYPPGFEDYFWSLARIDLVRRALGVDELARIGGIVQQGLQQVTYRRIDLLETGDRAAAMQRKLASNCMHCSHHCAGGSV